ncbi:MAG: hypothetical protein J6A69_10375 [Clostridia bacterium]|nr:hypothetical protein [Clostridia bacterium]
MKIKNKKLSYKMLNSFLLTVSMLVFLVSFMFESPVSSWVILSGIIINCIAVILRIMLQYTKMKSVIFEVTTILISIYMFSFGYVYQAYWVGLISVIFSYINHSNLFIKPLLNETFSKICSCTYRRYFNSDTEFVNVSEIRVGDFLQLFSGETVPCDGIVKAGSGTVNATCVTGDNRILNINKGDKIFAGFTVLSGKLIVESTNTVLESSLSKTIHCVMDINKTKTPKEKKISAISVVVSLVLFAVLAIFILVSGISSENYVFIAHSLPLCLLFSFEIAGSGLISDIYESVAVNLASKGIVVKSKQFIENTLEFENVGFSVKGVLGGKKPLISNVKSELSITEDELIKVAAYALFRTGSSMAKVIVAKSNSDINIADIRDFKPVGEYGGYVKICGDVEVVAGSVEDLNSYGIIVGLDNSEDTIYIGVDGKFAGFIQFETPLNEDIFQCMNNLRFAGIKNIFVYSHCNSEIANQISKVGNLKEVNGNLNDDQIRYRLKQLSGNTLMFRYGSNCADYSEYVNEIGFGGYDVFDRYDAVILTDNLLSTVNFVNVLKDAKGLILKNILISVIIKLILLIMLIFNVKYVWLAVILIGISLLLMRINNLKFRYKL